MRNGAAGHDQQVHHESDDGTPEAQEKNGEGMLAPVEAADGFAHDEGDRHLDFPAGAIPEDALPALLRDYVRGVPPEELSIFPLLLMGRFVRLEPEVRRVRKQPLVQLQVPAGTLDAVEITLEGASSTQSYAFEAASPHRLLRYRDAEGSEYRLAKAERMVYWRLHAPGDDAWWPASLRRPVGPPAPAPEGRP